jgi:hypothetical protein
MMECIGVKLMSFFTNIIPNVINQTSLIKVKVVQPWIIWLFCSLQITP